MAYYYVKNTGSSTTSGGTTKQTGAFSGLAAAAVYASVADAITYGAGSGDYICVSDSHSYTASTHLAWAGPTSGAPLIVTLVDDANCDQEATATSVIESGATGTGDFAPVGDITMRGMWVDWGDDLTGSSMAMLNFENCTLKPLGASDRMLNFIQDGSSLTSINCTWTAGSATAGGFTLGNGSVLTLVNSTVDTITGSLLEAGGNNGGYTASVIGCDLSALTDYLVGTIGGDRDNDDPVNIYFDGCKLNASLSGFVEETPKRHSQRIIVTRSSSSSSAAEYQYHVTAFGGVVDEDTSFYRDDSTAFPDSGQKISLKAVTNTDADVAAPFWFDFPTRYAELSGASKDVIRIYILSSTTLTDQDVWFEAIYPDGTTKNQFNFLSSRNTNLLATGTTLTSDTSTWTGRTSENRYYIDVDTSGDAGADCVPIIRVYVAKASTTIYFDTDIDLTTS